MTRVCTVTLVARCATRYSRLVIQSFRHKGLHRFCESDIAAVQPIHAKRLRMLLVALDTAQAIDDMDVPGFDLRALRGKDKGRWSVGVSGNWRVTFEFRDGHAYVIDYEDY
jgi:toxin HigB-1